MTGWRIGYIAAPIEIAKAVSSMQSHTTSNACSIAQYASVEALNSPESGEFVSEMQKVFDDRRKYMMKRIDGIPCLKYSEPAGAFYMFVDVSWLYGKRYKEQIIDGSLSFADAVLKKGVAVVPGAAFGNDDCIRLSYATSMEDIKEGIDRIAEFIREVK